MSALASRIAPIPLAQFRYVDRKFLAWRARKCSSAHTGRWQTNSYLRRTDTPSHAPPLVPDCSRPAPPVAGIPLPALVREGSDATTSSGESLTPSGLCEQSIRGLISESNLNSTPQFLFREALHRKHFVLIDRRRHRLQLQRQPALLQQAIPRMQRSNFRGLRSAPRRSPSSVHTA